MARIKNIILVSFILVVCTSLCSAPEKIPGAQADTYWNDLARFLAGMPIPQGSPLEKAAASESYKQHVSTMNKFWTMVQTENIDLILPWRSANLPDSYRNNTAFYPFSGADFVNLYTFFPRASSYIMVALEEPGGIPDPLKLAPWQLASGLSAIHRSIWTIASENYFKSGIMQKEMTNKYLEGTTPVLLIFAARLGLTVVDVRSVGLDAHGKIRELDKKGFLDGIRPQVYGTLISFSAPSDRRPRSLLYLKMRLSGGTLSEKSGEGLFFKKLSHLNVMIKSAVYLLHRDSFKDLCDFMRDRSDVILQDDSGIPYRYFERSAWNITLFGNYTHPRSLKDLPNPPHQPDLAREYARGASPLPFNFGYGVLTGKGKSNLLRAVKPHSRG